jgi:hypothetical protein
MKYDMKGDLSKETDGMFVKTLFPFENAWFILHFHGPFFSHRAQQKTLGVQSQIQLDGGFSRLQ